MKIYMQIYKKWRDYEVWTIYLGDSWSKRVEEYFYPDSINKG
jgi:hypothetical protein